MSGVVLAVVITLTVIISTALWAACGLPAARVRAPRAYNSYRAQLPYSARDGGPDFGRQAAVNSYIGCLILGPLSLLMFLAERGVNRSVPALVEAEAKRRRQELADLQAEIDQAHRDLGIRPLGRVS